MSLRVITFGSHYWRINEIKYKAVEWFTLYGLVGSHSLLHTLELDTCFDRDSTAERTFATIMRKHVLRHIWMKRIPAFCLRVRQLRSLFFPKVSRGRCKV